MLAITRSMIERGDEVHVFSFEEENDRRFRQAGARIVRPPFWFQPINPLDAVLLGFLWQVCRREKFDLVATHTSKGGFLGRLAAHMAGVPCIVHHAHGFSFNRPLGPLARRFFVGLERLAAGAGDLIISVNHEQRDSAVRYGVDTPDRICTVHNGIDLRPFGKPDRRLVRRHLGFQDSDLVVGAIGRLAPQKGLIYLIRAFPLILRSVPQAHLVIAGSGPLEAELKAEARRTGADNRIRFLGFRRDVPDLLSAFDVYAQPSLWEGLSISLIEALAAGCPVVTTDIESSREVVDHGSTGLLVAPADPVVLALAIEKLLSSPALTNDFSENGRRAAAERFSEERMVDAILAAYERARGSGHGRALATAAGQTRIQHSRSFLPMLSKQEGDKES